MNDFWRLKTIDTSGCLRPNEAVPRTSHVIYGTTWPSSSSPLSQSTVSRQTNQRRYSPCLSRGQDLQVRSLFPQILTTEVHFTRVSFIHSLFLFSLNVCKTISYNLEELSLYSPKPILYSTTSEARLNPQTILFASLLPRILTLHSSRTAHHFSVIPNKLQQLHPAFARRPFPFKMSSASSDDDAPLARGKGRGKLHLCLSFPRRASEFAPTNSDVALLCEHNTTLIFNAQS